MTQLLLFEADAVAIQVVACVRRLDEVEWEVVIEQPSWALDDPWNRRAGEFEERVVSELLCDVN